MIDYARIAKKIGETGLVPTADYVKRIYEAIMKEQGEPVREVYEKYKHLDKLLSDEIWIEGLASSPRRCLYDLWQAVKAHREV